MARQGINRGRILAYNGYRYQKNKQTKVSIYWRCWKKTCRAPLKTNLFDLNDENPAINVLQFENHDHEANDPKITAGRVFNEIKAAVKNDPTRPIKRSFDEVMACHDDSDFEELPGFAQFRTRLQRVRASTLPPLPHEIDDVEIQGEWSRTWRDRPFLSHLDNNWGIAIFSTNDNIRVLQRCDKMFMDGTFKTCPRPYTQFVTIHGQYLGNVFLLAMCVLSGKTVGHYRQVLQHLKLRVRNVTGHRWRPVMAICDFEHALILAIESELPNTRIKTCYFHFCQSLWRKIQELGLAMAYRQRRRLRRVLRMFMAIGHLPVALVRQNFNILSRDRVTRRLINRYPALGDFVAYVANTYIQGTFPVAMWNVYERGSDCRTNNIVEGFHNRWNDTVGVRHPSLWVFIRKLKDEERRVRLRMRRARQGFHDTKPKRKWRVLEGRITRLKSNYRNGAIVLDDYWRAISYAIKEYR